MGKKSVSVLAVFVAAILSIGKIITGIISKSSAILADGIHSGTDAVSSLVSYFGIKLAEKPADKEHPYGHEKAEVIAGFVITIIIFLSALYIIYDGIMSFFSSEPVFIGTLAFVVMAISTFANGIISQIKIHYGKKYNSMSLISDGLHSRIDLLASIAIFIGLFFIKYYSHIDSILALIVGVYILKESLSLGKETTDSLLGASAGEETENKIKEIIKKQNIKLDNLKTQKLGAKIFAEISIKLPSKIKVDEANKITQKLEQTLNKKIENLDYITIQVKGQDVGRGFYNTGLGSGGWRKARFKDDIKEASGKGPEGFCICPKCGKKISHKRGTPCSEVKCDKCNVKMRRE